jgi:hypothetical protein
VTEITHCDIAAEVRAPFQAEIRAIFPG